jgi:C-terminal processing protease CtpA/Prc
MVSSSTVEPLHDAHTFIDASSARSGFQGKKPGTLLLTDDEKKKTIAILETEYLESKLRLWCNGHVGYARLKNRPIGYMRVDAFSGYATGGGFDEYASALDAALDEIMRDVQELSGLIIDVRLNVGGSDPLGIRIASRLTGTPYVAFVKRARNDPGEENKWTAAQSTTVGVAAGQRFLKPVVELIGSDTVSAGETFTMALMGRRPQITRIGANTQGVYADVLVRHLPNGWRFGLPNEVFLTEHGKHYEAAGVPPDIPMAVFPKADLASGRDSVLERAIEVLSAPKR